MAQPCQNCQYTQSHKKMISKKEGAKRRRREDNKQEARAKLRRRQGTNSSRTKKTQEREARKPIMEGINVQNRRTEWRDTQVL